MHQARSPLAKETTGMTASPATTTPACLSCLALKESTRPYSARATPRVMPNPAATFTTTVKEANSERAVPHTKGGTAWGESLPL